MSKNRCRPFGEALQAACGPPGNGHVGARDDACAGALRPPCGRHLEFFAGAAADRVRRERFARRAASILRESCVGSEPATESVSMRVQAACSSVSGGFDVELGAHPLKAPGTPATAFRSRMTERRVERIDPVPNRGRGLVPPRAERAHLSQHVRPAARCPRPGRALELVMSLRRIAYGNSSSDSRRPLEPIEDT